MEPLRICVTNTAQINNPTEKRYDERCSCEAIVKWSRFNQSIQFDAKILNFSRSGIYLEVEQAIKPETIIIVRLEILLSGTWGSLDKGWLRTITFGKVKWCKDLIRNGAEFYGIGVQYYDAD
ncbi:MAG: PilZ domain-containing protein [Desulfobacterales bacterium]|jgi:hypothetical protein